MMAQAGTREQPVVIAIETSCDETAFALATEEGVVAHVVHSQAAEHAQFGGVIPELAARRHLEALPSLFDQHIQPLLAAYPPTHVAVTAGPGLVGGLLTGLSFGQGLAIAHDCAFVGVNHLEGHVCSALLTAPDVASPFAYVANGLVPPFLLVLVSGGHCMFVDVSEIGTYRTIGQTRDDAIGEAFDKTARLIGLGYPGGPAIQRCAAQLSPAAYADAVARHPLPQPMRRERTPEMSFSGFKSEVMRRMQALARPLTPAEQQEWAASIEHHLVQALVTKLQEAVRVWQDEHPSMPEVPVVIAGGVAANLKLRSALDALAAGGKAGLRPLQISAPPIALCTDNAAMISWAAMTRLRNRLPLEMPPRVQPRWPLV